VNNRLKSFSRKLITVSLAVCLAAELTTAVSGTPPAVRSSQFADARLPFEEQALSEVLVSAHRGILSNAGYWFCRQAGIMQAQRGKRKLYTRPFWRWETIPILQAVAGPGLVNPLIRHVLRLQSPLYYNTPDFATGVILPTGKTETAISPARDAATIRRGTLLEGLKDIIWLQRENGRSEVTVDGFEKQAGYAAAVRGDDRVMSRSTARRELDGLFRLGLLDRYQGYRGTYKYVLAPELAKFISGNRSAYPLLKNLWESGALRGLEVADLIPYRMPAAREAVTKIMETVWQGLWQVDHKWAKQARSIQKQILGDEDPLSIEGGLETLLALGPMGTWRFGVLQDNSPGSYWRDLERRLDGYGFSERPRLTARVEALLPEKGDILDLASGKHSVFQRKVGRRAIGMGLDIESMAMNDTLDEYVARDFNQDPSLPASEKVGGVVMSFGFMYQVHPLALLRSVYEQSKPGAPIVLVWKPTRLDLTTAVNIWNFPDLFGFRNKNHYVEKCLRMAGYEDIQFQSMPSDDGESHFMIASARRGEETGKTAKSSSSALKSFLPMVLLPVAGALACLAHSHLGVSAGGFEAAGMFSLVSPLAWLAESVLGAIGLLVVWESKSAARQSDVATPVELNNGEIEELMNKYGDALRKGHLFEVVDRSEAALSSGRAGSVIPVGGAAFCNYVILLDPSAEKKAVVIHAMEGSREILEEGIRQMGFDPNRPETFSHIHVLIAHIKDISRAWESSALEIEDAFVEACADLKLPAPMIDRNKSWFAPLRFVVEEGVLISMAEDFTDADYQVRRAIRTAA